MFELLGRTREEGPINGAAFMSEIVHPDYRIAFQQAMEATLQKGEPFHFEGLMHLADKGLRFIEVHGNLQTVDGWLHGQNPRYSPRYY